MNFRERPGHDRVVGGRDQLDPGLVVVSAHVFAVGRVENEEDVLGKLGAQPADVVDRDVGARRVVRIGEEHELRARGDRGEDVVHAGSEVGFRRDDRRATRRQGRDPVDEKPVLGEDRFVAGAEIGLGEQVQQFVGARAADDPVGVEPVGGRDCLAQRRRGAVRIACEFPGARLERLNGFGTRPEWGFIGRQDDRIGITLGLVAAGDIGLDIHNRAAWLRTAQRHGCSPS